MRILVIWRQEKLEARNTIVDHAQSFGRYDKDNEYFYFDILHGRFAIDYAWIKEGMFDVVIFHYTAVALRYSDWYWPDYCELMINVWKDYDCVKVLLMQDDYSLTGRTWDLANGIHADYIYTVMRECDHAIIYPKEQIGGIVVRTVLTGYVEASYLDMLSLKPHRQREYDVVYRARRLPYETGWHGQEKYEIAEIFRKNLDTGIFRLNICNTEGDQGAVLGNKWFDFLASSRLAIGCLSGYGIMDVRGEIRDRVAAFMKNKPDADFWEAKANCFPQCDDNLHGMVSPRVFECAMTKTAQVMLGEDYQGIMIPDVDYIMLKNDYGNLKEVIEKMRDVSYCEQIADNCYTHLVESGKYTYKKFVEYVIGEIRPLVKEKDKSEELSSFIGEMCAQNNRHVRTDMRYMEELEKLR